jgi:hypothetical protein
MSMQKQAFVVLTDDYIQRHVLAYGEMLREFPFLTPAKTAVSAMSGCARCQKNAKQRAATAAINDVKRAIGTLPTAQRERFKELLQADRVRVQWQEQVGNSVVRGRAEF